jgi:hypothetical protein
MDKIALEKRGWINESKYKGEEIDNYITIHFSIILVGIAKKAKIINVTQLN